MMQIRGCTFPLFLAQPNHVLTSTSGYEEEVPPEHYHGHNGYREEEYSPSPPHASGGSYYPHNNEYVPPPGGYFPNTAEFPPPPTGAAAVPQPEFAHAAHPTAAHPPADASIPPYNPQDYANQPGAHDPYGYPPQNAGDNVSSVPPVQTNTRAAASGSVPYFPPPTVPIVPNEQQHLRDGGAPSFPSFPPCHFSAFHSCSLVSSS